MNTVTTQISKKASNNFRLLFNIHGMLQNYISRTVSTTTLDVLDAFTTELLQRQKSRNPYYKAVNSYSYSDFGLRSYFMKSEPVEKPINITNLSPEELEKVLIDLLSKNEDKRIMEIVKECQETKVNITEHAIKPLLRAFSKQGKVNKVKAIISYCEKADFNLYIKNGEFLHFVARAQCMKGNSEIGLTVLKDCYSRYESLRSVYRIIFRELIQDSVLNRSEASMVIFKQHVLEFSDASGDHYPLICMWHICWMSTWFSDQMLANELFDSSNFLRNIVKDKAIDFSLTILKNQYNDDAVVRLLQSFLKHDMKDAYLKVLQVLFSYKLKMNDIRGCTEILRNCEALGIELPSDQQGKYIRLLIDGKYTGPPKPTNFKLKF
ncbi:unnamed protein product [Plutella xylostella]|uniref:(diamondback moth) hypothetical protein n=1 Tax=Plutella xylostella TaxID=51655 RepID=A0A8S4F920_PLUXY|nr:unnamed protein product [Plutella xylostella]